jgi:predicted AAA+ superfamily ATPase
MIRFGPEVDGMLEMAEKDILHSLERDNPWWADTGRVVGTDFAHTRAYFRNFKELALNWGVRRALILMGPRRVGKTVIGTESDPCGAAKLL